MGNIGQHRDIAPSPTGTAGSCHANINVGDLVEEPTYTYFVDSYVPEITLLGAGTGKIICGSDGLCA